MSFTLIYIWEPGLQRPFTRAFILLKSWYKSWKRSKRSKIQNSLKNLLKVILQVLGHGRESKNDCRSNGSSCNMMITRFTGHELHLIQSCNLIVMYRSFDVIFDFHQILALFELQVNSIFTYFVWLNKAIAKKLQFHDISAYLWFAFSQNHGNGFL